MEADQSLLTKIYDLQKKHYEEWVLARESSLKSIAAGQKLAKRSRLLALFLAAFFGLCTYWILSSHSLLNESVISGGSGVNALELEVWPKRHREARQWFSENSKHAGLFGVKRFPGNDQAVEFVNKLYSAGATDVYVTNIEDDDLSIKSGDGPYADALIVVLPTDGEKRKTLFKIYNDEMSHSTSTALDIGPKILYFWWGM